MNFPGDNTLSLTRDAVTNLIIKHVQELLGADVRITSVDFGTYSFYATKVSFTTDAIEVAQEGEQ